MHGSQLSLCQKEPARIKQKDSCGLWMPEPCLAETFQVFCHPDIKYLHWRTGEHSQQCRQWWRPSDQPVLWLCEKTVNTSQAEPAGATERNYKVSSLPLTVPVSRPPVSQSPIFNNKGRAPPVNPLLCLHRTFHPLREAILVTFIGPGNTGHTHWEEVHHDRGLSDLDGRAATPCIWNELQFLNTIWFILLLSLSSFGGIERSFDQTDCHNPSWTTTISLIISYVNTSVPS